MERNNNIKTETVWAVIGSQYCRVTALARKWWPRPSRCWKKCRPSSASISSTIAMTSAASPSTTTALRCPRARSKAAKPPTPCCSARSVVPSGSTCPPTISRSVAPSCPCAPTSSCSATCARPAFIPVSSSFRRCAPTSPIAVSTSPACASWPVASTSVSPRGARVKAPPRRHSTPRCTIASRSSASPRLPSSPPRYARARSPPSTRPTSSPPPSCGARWWHKSPSPIRTWRWITCTSTTPPCSSSRIRPSSTCCSAPTCLVTSSPTNAPWSPAPWGCSPPPAWTNPVSACSNRPVARRRTSLARASPTP